MTTSPRLRLRTRAAVYAAAAAGRASRVVGGGGGTIPGRVLLGLAPDALAQLGAGLPSALVSGTNGKTTTTRFLAGALSEGHRVLSNGDGANLQTGLATTLARRTRQEFDVAALEVDEVALPRAIRELAPRVVLLLNLSRDQLDRVSEVAGHVARWGDALTGSAAHLVANADDPLVTAAVRRARPDGHDTTWVAAGAQWQEDASFCPACAAPWRTTGPGWVCSRCELAQPVAGWASDGQLITLPDGRRLDPQLSLPGRANVANAAMAAAAAERFGVAPEAALARMRTVTDVAGRYLVVRTGGTSSRLLLAKNPAGWLEALDQLAGTEDPVVVAINAATADGTDPSWLWDVPFERLQGRQVVASGTRADDLAVRLHYAEVPHGIVADPVAAVHGLPPGPAFVVANYTAFTGIRKALA